MILGHTDPEHIARLANRLTDDYSDVYIHIDKKVDIEIFVNKLKNNNQVYFITNRFSISWGGYSSIRATLSLLKESLTKGDYNRFVLLQGLDYPIRSNKSIINFFEKNKDVEFIRACKITGSKDKYHSKKCEYFWFFDNKNIFKSAFNKFNYYLPVKLRKGYVNDTLRFDVYWGSAQWALTRECVEFVLDFSDNHKKFNNYFKFVFPPDETYFHSIIFNSHFSNKTQKQGPEEEKRGLVNWRNLHYFNYDRSIKVFTRKDYSDIMNSQCIFIRKVTTETSTDLLDLLDQQNIGN